MLSFTAIFFGLILPAIVCGGIFAGASLLPQSISTTHRLRLAAFAVGIGYIVGYLGIEGRLPLSPREGLHWLFYLAIAAMVVKAIQLRPAQFPSVHIAFAVAIPRIILGAKFNHAWGTFEELVWWVCLTLAIFFFFTVVEKGVAILPTGASQTFVFFGIAAGSAFILALSGSLRLAQHAGVLAAILAAVCTVMLILPRVFANAASLSELFLPAASSGVAFLLVGLWLNGYFYAEVPAVSAILLAVSPAMVWVGRRKSVLVQIGLIAVPVVIAMGIAIVFSGFFGGDSGY